MGDQPGEDYIQVGSIKWPLPRAPESEDGPGWDWGALHFSPLEPFSPTTVAGDDSLVSDDRIAQQVWADMRRGIGVFEYVESESLSGCQDSDLDTSQGVITLPTKKVAIGAGGGISAAWAAHAPIYGMRVLDSGNVRWLLWNGTDTTTYQYNIATDAWFTLSSTNTVYAIVPYAGYYYMATSGGLRRSSPGISALWGGVASSNDFRALCVHDGKLYAYDATLNKVVWTDPANAATAWPGVSAQTVPLEAGETVEQLLEWKDAFDNKCVTIVTDRRLILYSDQDYFGSMFATGRQGGHPRAHAWVRDGNLYLTDYPFSDTIWAIDHQSADEVSPNKLGGIQANQRFAVSHLAGDFRYLYAFCPNRTGKAYPGRVLKGSEAFGWSGLNRGKLANPEDWNSAVTAPITGGAYGQGEVLTIYADGSTVVQQSPDRGDLAYNVDDLTYENGPLWLWSAWTDCGLEDAAKIAAWFRLMAIKNDRTFGLPTGGAVQFKAEFDATLFGTYGPGATYPATIPLPDTNQAGQPFIRLRWGIGLTSTGVTPIIRSVGLHYERAPDIYDGLQVPIDLSRARFSPEDMRFYGLTRDDLLVELAKLKQAPGKPKRFYPVTLGVGNALVTYKACDVRVSGNIDPSTGYGILVFTLRDVSYPPSGLPVSS